MGSTGRVGAHLAGKIGIFRGAGMVTGHEVQGANPLTKHTRKPSQQADWANRRYWP